jgi:4-phytase/acid phosphatase
MFARLSCVLLLLAPFSFSQPAAQNPAADELKMVVILTRHGVRSPLSVPAVQDPWPKNQPDWGVDCCGDLTPSGEQLVRLMGAYYHDYYADPKRNLLPKECPAKEVYIRADNEERTVQTGRELAQGLAGRSPGCNILVDFQPTTPSGCTLLNDKTCQRKSTVDLLFHAAYPSDPQPQIQPIADDINGRYSDLLKQYRKPIDDLKATLCPAQNCLPLDCPSRPKAQCAYYSPDDKKLHWDGPFNVGSTASEIFLLEYASALPCAQVGWDRVTFKNLDKDCPGKGQLFRQMQEIHTAYFQETQRAPYIAKIQGTPLLNAIAEQLIRAKSGNPPAQKLVIYSGHDTNIANVAAMLGVCWKLPDLPQDDTPPAGAMVFELYKNTQTEKYSLHIRYVYQLLKQLRTKAALTLSNPPQWIEVAVPRCKQNCDLEAFQELVSNPMSERQACTASDPK